MNLQDLYTRLDDLQRYGSEVAKFPRFRAEVDIKSSGNNTLWIFADGLVTLHFYRKREEGIDTLFADAWQWLYDQPSPEKRELLLFIKKLTMLMEELGEGDSEIAKDLYRKIFTLREDAGKNLLEYKTTNEVHMDNFAEALEQKKNEAPNPEDDEIPF
jgi:hypothetical protein